MERSPFGALLLDMGGVILTNGWDRHARERAAERFNYNHEEGGMTLDQYLDHIVFFKERGFPQDDFKGFRFSQSQPYPHMLHLFAEIKARYGTKVVALSNEGRERALDLVLLPLDAVVYIDNTPFHVEVAWELGISAIVHVDRETTVAALRERLDRSSNAPHHRAMCNRATRRGEYDAAMERTIA